MNNDDIFCHAPENLTTVFSEFFKIFKSNPLLYVPMDEVLALWNEQYALNEDGDYQISEADLKEFMNKINAIQTDRIMVDMDKKGLATLGHDGTDICLIAKKDY